MENQSVAGSSAWSSVSGTLLSESILKCWPIIALGGTVLLEGSPMVQKTLGIKDPNSDILAHFLSGNSITYLYAPLQV